MADLTQLYGIGKGSAQVVDLRPVLTASEQARMDAERKAAEKMARKATKAAALNSMVGKLKNEGWTNHNTYLQQKLDGLNDFVLKEIGENGETVFAENQEKQSELKSQINDFVSWNQWSKNLTSEAEKQLERAQKSRKDIDVQSLGEFNKWLNESPEYQRTHPMPRIKDRNRSRNEIVKEEYSSALGKMAKRVVSTGKPDETGRISKSDITITDPEEFNSFIESISKDPNNQLNITAGEDAIRIIDGEGIIGRTIINEKGEEVNNPEFFKKYNTLKDQLIREAAEIYLPKEEKMFTATYKSGSGDDKEPTITEITDDEKGYVSDKNIEAFSKNTKFSASAQDEAGNTFFKTKVPMYSFQGKIYSKDELPEGYSPDQSDVKELKAGLWIDKDGNLGSEKDLKPTRDRTKYPVIREVTVQNSPVKKLRVNEVILPNGKKEVIAEGDVVEGKLIGYHKKNVNDVDDKIIHEGEKGYDERKVKTIEVATIQKKDGSTVETVVTDQVKNTFPKEFEKISENEPKDVTEEEYNALKPGDTYYYQGEKYTKK